MSHIAEDDRAAARCDGCENIYTVNIRPNGDIEPMVTKEYLEALRGRDKREVVQPDEYARPGAYPRSYSVRNLPQEDAIAITIEDFTTAEN